VEEAAASVLVALEVRGAAEAAMGVAAAWVGPALRVLIAEDVTVQRAAALVEIDAVCNRLNLGNYVSADTAALVEIDAVEVRRLVRVAGRSVAPADSVVLEPR
jgi:hypothetical protein